MSKLHIMLSLQEAKFNKCWTCEVKGCGKLVRIFRGRHHCRMCGKSMCQAHTLENITLLCSVQKVATNYKKICIGCHSLAIASETQSKSNYTINVESSSSISQKTASDLSSPASIDRFDVSSMASSSMSIQSAPEAEYETIEDYQKAILTKNQRIRELEKKVKSQGKELQSIAALVEKRVTAMQADINAKNNQIRSLEMEKKNYAAELERLQKERSDESI